MTDVYSSSSQRCFYSVNVEYPTHAKMAIMRQKLRMHVRNHKALLKQLTTDRTKGTELPVVVLVRAGIG